MDVAIHSLQTKLVLTETQCNTLVDIVMQAIQKNSYQMKMDADKGNIKFYNDKLEELEKGKEINPPNIQVTHVQQETNDGAAKKKKKNKKKNGKK
jgi:hypothetical protein